MPQFPRRLNEGDLIDAARGRPEMTGGHEDRGGAGRRVDTESAPSRGHHPCQTVWDPGSRRPRTVTGSNLARGTRGAGGTPVFPSPLLGVAAHTGQNVAGGERRMPTYMAGAAGRGLGRGSDGGGSGGGGSSRWLRLALATRDWKMAAARHPHPGTAAGAGRGRRHVASGPRGRGAAGPGVV